MGKYILLFKKKSSSLHIIAVYAFLQLSFRSKKITVTTATDDRAPDESLSRQVPALQTGQYRSVHCFHSLQQLAACSRVCVCEASCARSAAYVQPQKLVAINTHSHEADVSTSFFLPLHRLPAGDCTFD